MRQGNSRVCCENRSKPFFLSSLPKPPFCPHFFAHGAISARRPFTAFEALGSYKFDLIEYGLDFVFFHCTEDNRHIRLRVFGILQDHLTGLRIDALIVEKSRISAEQQAPEAFYPQMLGHLLRHVAGQNELEGIGELIVITDSIPVNRKRAAVEKAVKITLKNMLPPGCRFRVLHHPSMSSLGLQAADYCCWAVFRKWESGDGQFFDLIKAGVKSELAI
uniref:DUF3800 domain-containing protein n=1 Tax=Candidatus Electronema sp. TaxID=2698783 RepID=UPI004056EFD3